MDCCFENTPIRGCLFDIYPNCCQQCCCNVSAFVINLIKCNFGQKNTNVKNTNNDVNNQTDEKTSEKNLVK
jgi:hypothetical protein